MRHNKHKHKPDDYVLDCYEHMKPHIGHVPVRKGFILITSGTIEAIPETFEERREFFENNMQA